MTWNEFKTLVDKEIKTQNGSGEAEIQWIDIHLPEYHPFTVFADKQTLIIH